MFNRYRQRKQIVYVTYLRKKWDKKLVTIIWKKVITAWEKGKVENNELFDFLTVSFSKVKRSNEILLSHIWLFLNSNVIKNKIICMLKKITYFQTFMFTFSLVESPSLSRLRKTEKSEPRVVVWTKQKEVIAVRLARPGKTTCKTDKVLIRSNGSG